MSDATSAALVGAILVVKTPVYALSSRFLVGATKLINADHGGKGRIAGTVTKSNTPSDVPVSRRVRLHRKVDGLPIAETWSAADGSYAFEGIDERINYYVISFDHTNTYNGVIKDSITPVLL
jgi:hypothetical protein